MWWRLHLSDDIHVITKVDTRFDDEYHWCLIPMLNFMKDEDGGLMNQLDSKGLVTDLCIWPRKFGQVYSFSR